MKITNLSYTERKTLAQYEFAELTAHAVVEENDDVNSALLTLKTFVHNSINGKIAELTVENKLKEEVKPEPVVEEPVKEKKTRAKKEKPVETEPELPPVIEEPKKKDPKVVTYDSSISEHKSILAGYLSKKYDVAWKTVAPAEEIKAFTSSLNGQPFLDDVGGILPVFLEQIHTFFGA